MANVATLVFDIDSSGAVGAAKALAGLERAAASTATMSAKLQKQFRDANGRFISQSRAVGENADEIRRLAAAYNPALSAQLRFAQAQKDVAEAVRLGVIESGNQANVLRDLQAQYMITAAAATTTSGAMSTLDRSLSSSTHHSTNLMFQLQDIGMMMAAGQNPFMLMMQQGSQVAGIFGQMQAEGKKIGPSIAGAFTQLLNPMTAVTFAVIGGTAALTQWAVSAWGAAESADDFFEASDRIANAVSSVVSAHEATLTSVEELRKEYGSLAGAVREAQAAQLESKQRQLLDDIFDMQSSVSAGMEEILGQYTMWADIAANSVGGDLQENAMALESMAYEAQLIQERFGLSTAQVEQILKATQDLAGADGVEDVNNKAAILRDLLREADAAGANLPDSIYAVGDAITEAIPQLLRFINLLPGGGGTLLPGITATPYIDDERGSQSGVVADSNRYLAMIAAEERERQRLAGAAGSRRGGGGGVSDADRMRQDMERRLEALIEGFQTERQIIDAQYSLDQETLQYALDNKLLIEEDYNQRRLQMNTAYEQELQSIRLAQYSDAATGISAVLGEIANIQGTNNEKMLRAQRTFAAASALINAYEAGSQVLRDPTLPWFAKIGAAGSIIAAGLGMVSAIKGGGSSGARGGNTAPTTPATQKEPVKNTLIKLEGDAMFMDMAESLLQQIYTQSENGRVIIARG